MRLVPIMTEKSIEMAKDGKYSFWVPFNATKYTVAGAVEKAFGVKVKTVRTMNISGEVRRTQKGQKFVVKPKKKAVVVLKDKDKIDIYEKA